MICVPILIGCLFEPKVYFGFVLSAILVGFFLTASTTFVAGLLDAVKYGYSD